MANDSDAPEPPPLDAAHLTPVAVLASAVNTWSSVPTASFVNVVLALAIKISPFV